MNNIFMNFNVNKLNNFGMPNNNMSMNNNMMLNNNMPINNNMTPNNYYPPSNLISSNSFNNYNNIQLTFQLGVGYDLQPLSYNLKIEKIDSSSSLLFTCQKVEDVTLLYDYSSLLSFKELRQMNKNFNNCNNIDGIFNSIQNIITNYKDISIPRIEFCQNNQDRLMFFFRSPLMSGEIEDTSIILYKIERNIREQFNKLVKAYEDLKKNYNELFKKQNELMYNPFKKWK